MFHAALCHYNYDLTTRKFVSVNFFYKFICSCCCDGLMFFFRFIKYFDVLTCYFPSFPKSIKSVKIYRILGTKMTLSPKVLQSLQKQLWASGWYSGFAHHRSRVHDPVGLCNTFYRASD